MAARESRSFCATMIACAIVGLAGALLLGGSRLLPVYTIPFEQADRLFMDWCSPKARIDRSVGDAYWAAFGWRYALSNSGLSLVAGAATAAIGAFLLRASSKPQAGKPWLRTPGSRAVFLLLGVGVIGWFCLAELISLVVDLDRRYFPWCADSIGIPGSGIVSFSFLLTLVCVAVGGALMHGFGTLPVALAIWNRTQPRKSWSVTIVMAIVALACILLAAVSIAASAVLTPATVIAVYLIASTRAALLAPSTDSPALGRSPAIRD